MILNWLPALALRPTPEQTTSGAAARAGLIRRLGVPGGEAG
ncbi:hypothetical protein [Micromonospora fulviviridis]|uniref:Uncharacterized protein n=1 Tax=Micromonospora fulviviridis TaxID=47860 RepID=A0ABV2VFK5_9ACTN